MTDLAKLVVKLEAETSKYQAELEKARKQLGGFTEAEKQAADAEEARQKAMADGIRVFEQMRTPVEKYAADLERLNGLLTQGAIDQETFNRATAAAAADLEKSNEAIAQGKKIFDQTRTPLENYNSEMANLQRLLKSGAIDQETFNRAQRAAKKQFEDNKRALRENNESYQAVTKGLKIAGAAALAAGAGIVALVKSSIDSADAMSKLAQSTGISTRTLSELAYAGKLADVSNEELAKSLAKLAKTAVDAAEGGKSQAAAFRAAGVSVTDASGKMRATDEILLDIAESFAGLEDGAAKAALAQDLFGKSGAKLIPFLNQGRAGIEELREEARRLGISLSDEAGKAAEEFNDNLTRLSAVARGFGMQIAQELLPSLVALSDQWVESAKQSELFSRTASTISTIIKGIIDFALGAATAFQKLGIAIGAGAAAAVQLAQGNFSQAKEIWKTATDDALALEAEYQKMRVDLWKDGGADVLAEVEVTAKKIKKALTFGGEDAVAEVAVTAKAIDIGPLEEFYNQLDAMTQTNKEKALESIYAQKAALEELKEARRVTDEEYRARLEAIQQAENDALGITERQQEAEERRKKTMEEGRRVFEETRTPLEKYNAELERLNNLLSQGAIDQETFNRAAAGAKEDMEKAADGAAAFFDQAKRNAQTILGDGINEILEKGFSEGGKSAEKAFKDMLRRLASEAAAAQIWKWIFGDQNAAAGSSGGGGGGLSDIFKIGMSLFGGSRDSGGRGKSGVAYAIGKGAQPEMFVPDTAGTFVPANQWMGGGQKLTQNIYVEGRVDQRSARQLELEASRRQNVARSRLG